MASQIGPLRATHGQPTPSQKKKKEITYGPAQNMDRDVEQKKFPHGQHDPYDRVLQTGDVDIPQRETKLA